MLVLLGCVAAAYAYGRGVRALWNQAGSGRGVRRWQAACFASGLLAILFALGSPLDEQANQLFAIHMVQHLLLILAAGPLLILGLPLAAFAWAAPEPWRPVLRTLRHLDPLGRPAAAFTLHSLALWLWHVPRFYDAALANPALHVLEHVSFLGSAVLFWWSLLRGGRAGYGMAVLFVFALALQSTVLGALLTFAGGVWYTGHLATTAAWGVSPADDQQLAGLIMWIPGGAIYLASALALFVAWLKHSGRPGPAAQSPVDS
jgi:putative membrane protein